MAAICSSLSGRQRVAQYRQVDRANNASAGKDFLDGGPPARQEDSREQRASQAVGELGISILSGRAKIEKCSWTLTLAKLL